MRKSTFYGLATLCGAGSLFFVYVWFFPGRTTCCHPPSVRVDGDFISMSSAIKLYHVNAGRPPTSGQGLEALVAEPTTGPKPRRWSQVMTKVPLDPWETPYRYTHLAPKTTEWCCELRSAGEDREFGTPDDVATELEWGRELPPMPTRAETSADARPSY